MRCFDHVRSGNERVAKIAKTSKIIGNGIPNNKFDLCLLDDIWMAWGFQVNFMYYMTRYVLHDPMAGLLLIRCCCSICVVDCHRHLHRMVCIGSGVTSGLSSSYHIIVVWLDLLIGLVSSFRSYCIEWILGTTIVIAIALLLMPFVSNAMRQRVFSCH